MAIEDGVVLARCLAEAGDDTIPEALARYQAARHDRTSRIQIGSRGNEWLKAGGNAGLGVRLQRLERGARLILPGTRSVFFPRADAQDRRARRLPRQRH